MKRVSLIFCIFLLFGLLCLWPLLNAGLHTDDWGWLALAHMLENPLASYTQNILWGYFYRPSTMVFWWISERMAGSNSTLHYIINIVLHCCAATCLTMLMRTIGRPAWLSICLGLAYLCCPAIAGTSFWLSSRNEMLAIFFGLCSMLVLEQEINKQRFRGFAIGFLLFVALTAKESAYLFPVACTLRVFFDGPLRSSLDGKTKFRISLCLLIPLAAAAYFRSMTIIPIGPEANPDSLFETLRTGITHWFSIWPSAISGFDAQRIYWIYFAAIAILLMLAISRLHSGGKTSGWGIATLALVLIPSALQAPITTTILNQSNAMDFPENLRFFATSGLGALLFIGICIPLNRFIWLSRISVFSLLLIGGITSFNMAVSWRDNTQADDREARQLAEQVALAMAATRCQVLSRIIIESDISPSIAPWIDPVLKSQWPRNSNLQHCSFFVKAQQGYYQILPLIECDASRWSNTTSGQFMSKDLLLPLNSICQTSMLQPNEDNATATIEVP